MKVLSLEFEVSEEIRKDALKFFAKEAKYLILLAEDGASKVIVLKETNHYLFDNDEENIRYHRKFISKKQEKTKEGKQ